MDTTIGCKWIPVIYENLQITFVEDTTLGRLYSLMFNFLPLPFISYYQTLVCIALLYQR